MSEVKRWKLKGFLPGVEGETKAVFQPTVVLAEDYDAALAREAALRDELYRFKRLRSSFLNRVLCDRDALQQRLTNAEKRAGDLGSLLPSVELALKALNVAVSVYDVELADNARRGLRELIAALKPVEGEGS